ncbi:MAG: NAD-dependent epimerase/dehydratase family protein [Anaerolineales bacterium]
MKILMIGGTGIISSACSELIVKRGMELTLLNRSVSTKFPIPEGARHLVGDIYGDPARIAGLLHEEHFDAVVNWVAYTPEHIEHNIRLFSGLTEQFVFISSASAYQKPPAHYIVTEETPLENPFWDYSRNKIAAEQRLMQAYREHGFPATIIRPSLTYGPSQIPLAGASWGYPYTVIDRIRKGKKIIIPGDGTSLWTVTWNGDFAKGLVGLLGQKAAIGEAFHITSDEVLSWNQIFAEVGKALSLDMDIVHIASDLIAAYSPGEVGSLLGDKSHSAVYDNSKIKRFVPDFKCEVPWAEGVRRAIAWHEADPARMTIDDEMNRAWDTILAAYERAWPK